MGQLTKVMKYELRYVSGCGEFHDMQSRLWGLQKQVREILNFTIQTAYQWDFMSREHYCEAGEYLDVKVETGYKTLDGHIYNLLKGRYGDMCSYILGAAIQRAWKKYKNAKKDIFTGSVSLPSYRNNQPILFNKESVKIWEDGGQKLVSLTVFSKSFKKQNDIGNAVFRVVVGDGTQKAIVERVISGEYKLGECQLVYEDRKWFLLLTYTFTAVAMALNPDKILGVDLGECVAVYASVYGEHGAFRIDGGEVTAYAKQVESRRRALQRQAVYCGDGRIGHGTKTRVRPIYEAKEKIENFRNTINHRYSKALVDYAVKNGCGVIQMEDLSEIKQNVNDPKFLRHWTYYDLQSKVESKAKARGIEVRKINPRYTSLRCSKCGTIDRDNRPSQSAFVCTNCGFSANADYNASQNIAINGIENLISNMCEQEADNKIA